jgi:type I restriction enzyme S subunit
MTETVLNNRKYSVYPEYKISGIEWLEAIPSHWIAKKIKNIGSVTGGYAFKSTDFKTTGYPVVKISNVSHLKLNWEDESFLPEHFKENHSEYIAPSGSLVFAMTRPVIAGGIKVCLMSDEREPLINQRVGFLNPKDTFVARFILYSSLSPSFVAHFVNNMTITNQPNISSEGIESIPIAIPPYEELSQIANFLDHETAKIDTLIAKQEKLIGLLKEKRQTVISHAVTRGLTPDAPMKDSGVEWLGEVPELWKVSHMDYVLNAIGDVDHYMPKSVDKGIPYVMTGDLTEFTSCINFEDCKQVNRTDYLKLSKKIKSAKGDIIMARYATIGTASYIDVDREFLVSYSCVTIKPNLSKVLGLYLFYYFKSHAFIQGIRSQINSNTQDNVGVNDLKKVKVVLPPLTEQMKAIEYLQSIIGKLDSLSENAKSAINLMKERKTALISAAVTGKIDVRNWQK